jgi:predicted transposase YbfD/YdcC
MPATMSTATDFRAHTIIEEKADYVLQVKDNQQRLHEDIALFFQDTENGAFDTCETIDGDHGRIETRQYYTTSDIDWLPGKHLWAGIKTIAMAVRQWEINAKVSTETSYFISSLENHPRTIANAIREHWGIENGLHWCLDIAFREDDCRVRKDHAPENLGIVRHMAINLLKRETSLKGGIRLGRLISTCDCPDFRRPNRFGNRSQSFKDHRLGRHGQPVANRTPVIKWRLTGI